MARRREARRLAVDILFQADQAARPPADVLAERRRLGTRVPAFAEELVLGVQDRAEELDALLGEHAEGWKVERMAVVDRIVLRLAAFELLHREDIPPAVAIDEAVRAVKELSTEDSGRFVNGILGRIARNASAG